MILFELVERLVFYTIIITAVLYVAETITLGRYRAKQLGKDKWENQKEEILGPKRGRVDQGTNCDET